MIEKTIEINETIYLPKAIREEWKGKSLQSLLCFLEVGRKLFIRHAKMKKTGKILFEDYPLLEEVFS